MPAKKGKKAYSSGTNDKAKQNSSRKLTYNENVSSVHIYEFIQNGFVENIYYPNINTADGYIII